MAKIKVRIPDFGTATARKSGRNPKYPYVPIIRLASPLESLHQTTQIRGLAYATRQEAVDRAQRAINSHKAAHERKLVIPRLRTNREHWGFPRELIGAQVTTTQPDEGGEHPIGTVVQATLEERDEGAAELGLPPYSDELADCSLVEWPTGRHWERPDGIRLVRQAVVDA